MTIYISGSLAYDRIMTFPGRFADHILPDKIHMLNVSFTVSGMVERPGGCAGNIAYCLALLGEQPLILGTLGEDSSRYLDWLGKNGITSEGIRVIEGEFTASAYITTDQGDNQITGFNPGAMKYPSGYPIERLVAPGSIGVIAPGNLEDMAGYRNAFAAAGTPFIFDPGQSLPAWEADALRGCISAATVLIGNDYELEMITTRLGLTREALLDLTRTVIVTKAEHGSLVLTRDGEAQVRAVDLGGRAVDPTGAGDAYRGGLVKGMIEGKDIVACAKMGSAAASFAVEVQGTQEYRFTMAEFYGRLETL